VVDGRGAIEAAELGIITKHEAASLLLAHFHSSLFALVPVEAELHAWWDPALVDDVVRGLFGARAG
jgi:hypothetical protein